MTLFWAAGRAFTTRLLATLGGALALFWALGIVDAMGHARTGHGSLSNLALLALAAAFDEVCLLLPPLCFLAVLATTTAWAQSGELEAALCSGRSPFAMAAPMAQAALTLGLLAFVYQETAGQQIAAWRRHATTGGRMGGSALGRALSRHTAWVQSGAYILHLPERGEVFSAQGREDSVGFNHPTLYRFSERRLEAILVGDALIRNRGHWSLRRARQHSLLEEGIEKTDVRAVDLPISGQDLLALSVDPATASLAELFSLAARRERTGLDGVGVRLAAYRRLILAISAPLWVLLATPLAFRPDRKRSLAHTLGQASAIIALTLGLGHLFRLIALAHALNPLLAVLLEPWVCGLGVLGTAWWPRVRFRQKRT